MTIDRYTRVILTVIAVELLWLGVRGTETTVSAQAGVTRVVITGIEMGDSRAAVLPVDLSTPVRVDARYPVKIEADRPIRVETDRPLLVQSVPYTPGARPGD